jgi:hypothetical protein
LVPADDTGEVFVVDGGRGGHGGEDMIAVSHAAGGRIKANSIRIGQRINFDGLRGLNSGIHIAVVNSCEQLQTAIGASSRAS